MVQPAATVVPGIQTLHVRFTHVADNAIHLHPRYVPKEDRRGKHRRSLASRHFPPSRSCTNGRRSTGFPRHRQRNPRGHQHPIDRPRAMPSQTVTPNMRAARQTAQMSKEVNCSSTVLTYHNPSDARSRATVRVFSKPSLPAKTEKP